MIMQDLPLCEKLDRHSIAAVHGGQPHVNIDGSWLMASPVIAINVETTQTLSQTFDTIGSYNTIMGGYYDLSLLNIVDQNQMVSVPVTGD